MTTVRYAAILFLLYAAALIANGALYISESGDMSEVPRGIARVVGVVFVAVGLWQTRRWAWWAGVLLGLLFFALGLVGAALLHSSGVLETRPHPAIDYLFFVVSLGSLLGALVLLLLPRSRSAIRSAA